MERWMPSWGAAVLRPYKIVALGAAEECFGPAGFNNFLTRASGLPKPWPRRILLVGMRAASQPFAWASPGCGRRSPRPPYSYGDTGFIDACFAGMCLPDLRPFSLAARRAEPQEA